MRNDVRPKAVRRRPAKDALRVVGPSSNPNPRSDKRLDSECHVVKWSSERWREKVEALLLASPSEADLQYIESFLTRLRTRKFGSDSQSLTKMRAEKALRAEKVSHRRLRR